MSDRMSEDKSLNMYIYIYGITPPVLKKNGANFLLHQSLGFSGLWESQGSAPGSPARVRPAEALPRQHRPQEVRDRASKVCRC